MEIIDLINVLQLTPTALSAVLLWKLFSLERELHNLRDLHVRHLEQHGWNHDS